jgi:kynureninase
MPAMTLEPSPFPSLAAAEAYALDLDRADPLASFRDHFALPPASAAMAGLPGWNRADVARDDGAQPRAIYLTGNSLGAMPKAARELINQQLDDWSLLGVEGHVHGSDPWLPYHEQFREPLARLVGALPHEVVCMNSLTVNLHLLMASFYRPTRERYAIIIEDTAFPSDSYAVMSQARFHASAHNFDPAAAIIRLKPRDGESTLRTEDIEIAIAREAPRLALVMLGAVNYLTGQWFDMERITRAAHSVGALCGWDLAHAVGNVPMRLHDIGADFAAWCSYKYLNSGAGAIAGAFVHETHVADKSLPQFAGWWGNDPATRFKMGPEFSPVASADRWQLSNPPIFAMIPIKASLSLFDSAGIDRLRAKSLQLTGLLQALIDLINAPRAIADQIKVLTPRDPNARGCQLSLVMPGDAKQTFASLQRAGIICDFREPNVIRAAPIPLYTRFHEVWRFAHALEHATAPHSASPSATRKAGA